jgi:hypothetical protein
MNADIEVDQVLVLEQDYVTDHVSLVDRTVHWSTKYNQWIALANVDGMLANITLTLRNEHGQRLVGKDWTGIPCGAD